MSINVLNGVILQIKIELELGRLEKNFARKLNFKGMQFKEIITKLKKNDLHNSHVDFLLSPYSELFWYVFSPNAGNSVPE